MLKWFESLDYLTIVGAFAGIASLLVALKIGIGDRTLFRSKLELKFLGDYVTFKDIPKRLAKRDPFAFLISIQDDISMFGFICVVTNNTKRKVSDVIVELTYPRQFYAPHRRTQLPEFQEFITQFPERLAEYELAEKFAEKRTASPVGGMMRTQFAIDVLRPGEHCHIFENLAIPAKDKAFLDPRFDKIMFSDVLENLSDLPLLRGFCHIQVSILSDLNKPISKKINVLPIRAYNESQYEEEILSPIVNSFWLYGKPDGVPFYKFPWNRNKLVNESPVVLMIPHLDSDILEREGRIVRSTHVEPMQSKFSFASIYLPAYDYFRLPKGTTVEEAIATTGYHRAGRRPVL